MEANNHRTGSVLVLGAVASEILPLVRRLVHPRRETTPFGTVWKGALEGVRVAAAVTGIGKVNAAGAAVWLLERCRPRLVCVAGSAGAYPGAPLRIGDVLVASEVQAGDEGVWTSEGIRSMRAIGLALAHQDGLPVFGRFSLHQSPWYRWVRAVTPEGNLDTFRLRYGPLVTVGMVSGDERIALQRFSRYDAWAEDMEGSAVAQVCLHYGVPVLQCRGISNWAGTRDKARWRLEDALAHCHEVIRKWFQAGLPLENPENSIAVAGDDQA